MSHVMVPCPEEHVDELQLALMRLTLGMAGWDDDSIARWVGGLEPTARRLVDHIARASVDRDRLPYRDAARALGISVGDVLELVTDLNDRSHRASLPMMLMTDTQSGTADDGTRTATPVLVIVRPVAERVLALGRREGAETA